LRCYIGLGSNLGDRRAMIEAAASALRLAGTPTEFRLSPVYSTPALVPDGGPLDWFTPYLNAVAELQWSGSAQELLKTLKRIETELGRTPGPRWSPRLIDLDLLIFGTEVICEERLRVPHPEILRRSFVLDPLKDLAPGLVLPGTERTALELSRQLPRRSALIMGILNLTPDSFSDGGELDSEEALVRRVQSMEKAGVHIIDIGAESTRPGASIVPPELEWTRLQNSLMRVREIVGRKLSGPMISVDTRNAQTAVRALSAGADWINDVSGLSDPDMISVLRETRNPFVIMHHLGIPADPKIVLDPHGDLVGDLKSWLWNKLDLLDRHGISAERVIFDPGIGFGKSAYQSIALLKRNQEFASLPVRILIGHSRKSFMKVWSEGDMGERDALTLGASLGLASRGADILRVHTPEEHLKALQGYQEMFSK
jgi:2-amino-4-hydroxy-6-hydroxymethyldihydropteridine diphosphokinase / dihydropteroate synthase